MQVSGSFTELPIFASTIVKDVVLNLAKVHTVFLDATPVGKVED